MISYRLVQTRRHDFELRAGAEVIAEIAFGAGARASVATRDERYDLEAVDGIRRRVLRHDQRDATIARMSSVARYAVDLESLTLYWHLIHGPAGTYGWKTAGGSVVARYAAAGDGDFVVQVDEEPLPAQDREHIVIIGAYLVARTWIEVGPYSAGGNRSHAPGQRTGSPSSAIS